MTSLLLTICVGPWFIRKLYELKVGAVVRVKDCPVLKDLHAKKEDTPTMGGILILFSVTVAAFFFIDLHCIISWMMLILMWLLGLLGMRDDYLKMKHKHFAGVKAKKKFFFQIAIAISTLLPFFHAPTGQFLESRLGLKVPSAVEQYDHAAPKKIYGFAYLKKFFVPMLKKAYTFDSPWHVGWIFAFFLFVITAFSNAVNLTDGLDGLAAGSVLLVSLVMAIFAFLSGHREMAGYLNILYIEGSCEIAIFFSAVVGSLLGFLWYNSHPAQIFMGDTGSLSLGGIIGFGAILLRRELVFGIVGGIFAIEALSVVCQVASFKTTGRRVLLCAPIHHHYQYMGIAETKIVFRFWVVGIILALIGILTIKFQ